MKTGKMRKQYGICFSAWPQGISVSSYRKKPKKAKAEGGVLLRTHVIRGPQGVPLQSPGDESDTELRKGCPLCVTYKSLFKL